MTERITENIGGNFAEFSDSEFPDALKGRAGDVNKC